MAVPQGRGEAGHRKRSRAQSTPSGLWAGMEAGGVSPSAGAEWLGHHLSTAHMTTYAPTKHRQRPNKTMGYMKEPVKTAKNGKLQKTCVVTFDQTGSKSKHAQSQRIAFHRIAFWDAWVSPNTTKGPTVWLQSVRHGIDCKIGIGMGCIAVANGLCANTVFACNRADAPQKPLELLRLCGRQANILHPPHCLAEAACRRRSKLPCSKSPRLDVEGMSPSKKKLSIHVQNKSKDG